MGQGADIVLQAKDDLTTISVPVVDANVAAVDLTDYSDPKFRIWTRGSSLSSYELSGTIQSPVTDGIIHFSLPSGGLVSGVYDVQILLTKTAKTIRTKRYRLEVTSSLPATT